MLTLRVQIPRASTIEPLSARNMPWNLDELKARTATLEQEVVASFREWCWRLAWLGAVWATQVAERAGHSVDVLLRVYAKCLDGQDAEARKRVQAALGGPV
jgi:hypothetical protein